MDINADSKAGNRTQSEPKQVGTLVLMGSQMGNSVKSTLSYSDNLEVIPTAPRNSRGIICLIAISLRKG
ncbi:hypothetical protein CCP3SC1AL1_1000009 [Gammaproteobacteria bacterium]